MSIHPLEPKAPPSVPSDDDMRLHFEVQRLYAVEARLLDQHRYADWLELFADDLHYWAPVRTNRLRRQQALADGSPGEVAIFDETRASLAWRIRRFDSGMAWAEDPPSRTRHLISNVLVRAADEPGEYVAESAFLCYRNRLEREVDLYAGGRTDVLRRDPDDGRLLIARRTILLDQNVLLAKNISTFL
ncbi:3-phenylpropionate/cinnamic acid dioxygenase subunit beta [Streptomyces phyllanthi]|uniref:3-phenylpropionate/cinnamic acid dioxygenase subunit beta n=1 Tax=Streptomyces phyllanthi TaxID=1803180 RepID=A0A5N8W3R3_9ACTN|nr:3-phenylpropionate/cinnamic acid dioxygenase subunit beta [Streptomyces phyllanthi]MPY40944.1 3-phenylpropionate/cinnamic acid dioxygenase subunit beta [Streptomyces phyllanthi]